MPKFFAYERAAHAGEKQGLRNVEFKKNDFENSLGAQAGSLLEIIPVHIKKPPVIQFIAYLESLSDRFNPTYSEQQPFGRLDPYYVWKSSKRSISVSIAIPSSSLSKGLDNLNNLGWFLASTYPTYKNRELANSIAASPIFRVRYANLIASRTQGGQGILCTITGINVTHDLKAGFISAAADAQAVLEAAGLDANTDQTDRVLIPKLIRLSMQLNVLHDHSLGWDFETGEWRGGATADGYPYGVGTQRDVSDTPNSNQAPQGGNSTAGGSNIPGTPDNRATQVVEGRSSGALNDDAVAAGGIPTIEK